MADPDDTWLPQLLGEDQALGVLDVRPGFVWSGRGWERRLALVTGCFMICPPPTGLALRALFAVGHAPSRASGRRRPV